MIVTLENPDVDWGSNAYYHKSCEVEGPFERVARLISNNAQQWMTLETTNGEPQLVGTINAGPH